MKNKIITSILLILLGATLVLWLQNRSLSKENVRLETNTETLMSQMETYRNSLGQSVAHVGTLELTIKELKRYREKLEGKIKDMDVRLKKMQSLSINAITTDFSFAVPIYSDKITHNKTQNTFSWSDCWNSVSGTVSRDSVRCSVRHRDTLDQVIYRVPKRFLFIRYGTKGIRQAVKSRDPNSTIVYSEYIVLKRER